MREGIPLSRPAAGNDPGFDVAVIGAGAAGILAAARAAERGRRTILLEKNRKPGAKILMSGGTRCNLTHAVEPRAIAEAFGPKGRFLGRALAALPPRALVQLVEAEGVGTKVEPTGKIFPATDRASDVLAALLQRLARSGALLAAGEPVAGIGREGGGFRVRTAARTLAAARVILTTGGMSYPRSGTTGDGYAWAAALGHSILAPRPALVPLKTGAPWVPPLAGVTIPDVGVRVAAPAHGAARGRTLEERRGSFLFTHVGLSGPAVLDASRAVTGHPDPAALFLECDFLPGEPDAALDAWLREAACGAGARQVATILDGRLPGRLGEALLDRASIPRARRSAELSAAERRRLLEALKRVRIPISGTLGFPKAEVTAGGVPLPEVDPRTMESRRCPGLFLAGEILDLDGPIGGYNFQAAFSTGWLAGTGA